ncbi:Hypothetical predicted protein [Paramuricea clavata]|uniref:Uncharacterized protein n=1 Tax=Paramuricea clavata TaxID=317549 RepID=A0A6S7JD80_PARCT|nr:Hypothetical predicted protein [Paramuricea clavata]
MASSSSSGNYSNDLSTYKDVQGYVHSVSDVKVPANSKSSRYFDFKMQQGDEETRVVCFNAEYQGQLRQKEQSKSPCRLTNEASDLQVTTIKEVLENKINGNIVTLKARMVTKSNVQTVFSRNMQKDLRKCDVVIADESGTISVTIWEDVIDQVQPDCSYHFQSWKVSFFNNKYHNATKDTKIGACDSVDLCPDAIEIARKLNVSESVDNLVDVSGNIVGIDVDRYYMCINCKGRVEDLPNQTILKCLKCRLSIKKSAISCNTSDPAEQHW